MKKLLAFTLIAAILIAGCAEEKPVAKIELDNKVKDCQCHEEPWKYKPHVTTSCLDCHGNEIIDFHKPIFEEKGVNATDVANVDCYACHEKSLLANHLPKYSCELCHGDIYSIHEEHLKKYYEVVSK